MKHLSALVLFIFVLLASCASETPGTRTTCEDGELEHVRVRFSVDGAFTAPEREALQQATDDWFILSGGHIDFSLSYDFDNDTGNPHIYRLESWMSVVREKDAKASADLGAPYAQGGWQGSDDIYLVVDRYLPGQIRYLATHELGHAAGLAWPNCRESRSFCIHSPDPKAVMFPSGPHDDNRLTQADGDFCRASCLCP